MLRLLGFAGLALGLTVASAAATVQPFHSQVVNALSTPASQTVDRCHKQCAPLLNLDSRSEAKRTYANCRALCAGKGSVTCPDGSRQSVDNPRCGGPRSGRPRWRRYR